MRTLKGACQQRFAKSRGRLARDEARDVVGSSARFDRRVLLSISGTSGGVPNWPDSGDATPQRVREAESHGVRFPSGVANDAGSESRRGRPDRVAMHQGVAVMERAERGNRDRPALRPRMIYNIGLAPAVGVSRAWRGSTGLAAVAYFELLPDVLEHGSHLRVLDRLERFLPALG